MDILLEMGTTQKEGFIAKGFWNSEFDMDFLLTSEFCNRGKGQEKRVDKGGNGSWENCLSIHLQVADGKRKRRKLQEPLKGSIER